MRVPTLSLAALAVLALLSVPFAVTQGGGGGGSAGVPGFGTVVAAGDEDAVRVLRPADVVFCFVDDDGSLSFDASEPVYLGVAHPCDLVASGDVRVANPPVGVPGSFVTGASSDGFSPLSAFAGGTAFLDADGDGVYGPGETAYLDSDGDGTVTAGDVALSGAAAGTVVPASSPSLHQALDPGFSPQGGFFDGDGDSFLGPADTVYLDDPSGSGAGLATADDLVFSGPAFGQRAASGETVLTYASFYASFCFLDGNGDGLFGADEAAYLAMSACSRVASGDIRLANPPVGSPGSLVSGASFDSGQPLQEIPGWLGTFDANGDARYNPDETVYLDADFSSDVDVGDLVLSGPLAGTVVSDATHGLGASLDGIYSPLPTFLDADADGAFGAGDTFYLDEPNGDYGNGAALVTAGDLTFSGPSFGTVVTEGTRTLFAVPGAAFCFMDDDASGAFAAGEPVYVAMGGCGTVAAHDLRVALSSFGAPGSLVMWDSSDLDAPTLPFPGDLALFDLDGDAMLNPGEAVYLDTDASDTVTAGDVRLTGADAGTVVADGEPDAGSDLSPGLVPAMAFWDADQDQAFSPGDRFYVDDPSQGGWGGFVTVSDIRLGGTDAAGGSPSVTSPPTPSTSSTGPSSTSSGGGVTGTFTGTSTASGTTSSSGTATASASATSTSASATSTAPSSGGSGAGSGGSSESDEWWARFYAGEYSASSGSSTGSSTSRSSSPSPSGTSSHSGTGGSSSPSASATAGSSASTTAPAASTTAAPGLGLPGSTGGLSLAQEHEETPGAPHRLLPSPVGLLVALGLLALASRRR